MIFLRMCPTPPNIWLLVTPFPAARCCYAGCLVQVHTRWSCAKKQKKEENFVNGHSWFCPAPPPTWCRLWMRALTPLVHQPLPDTTHQLSLSQPPPVTLPRWAWTTQTTDTSQVRNGLTHSHGRDSDMAESGFEANCCWSLRLSGTNQYTSAY